MWRDEIAFGGEPIGAFGIEQVYSGFLGARWPPPVLPSPAPRRYRLSVRRCGRGGRAGRPENPAPPDNRRCGPPARKSPAGRSAPLFSAGGWPPCGSVQAMITSGCSAMISSGLARSVLPAACRHPEAPQSPGAKNAFCFSLIGTLTASSMSGAITYISTVSGQDTENTFVILSGTWTLCPAMSVISRACAGAASASSTAAMRTKIPSGDILCAACMAGRMIGGNRRAFRGSCPHRSGGRFSAQRRVRSALHLQHLVNMYREETMVDLAPVHKANDGGNVPIKWSAKFSRGA